jgi:hypothetical protein
MNVGLIAILSVALAFPACAAAVFVFGCDRAATSHVLSAVFVVGIYAFLLAPFFERERDAKSNKKKSALEVCALRFVAVSAFLHTTWELAWLLFHDAISANRDAVWAYPWSAYSDGGDARYSVLPGKPIPTLLLVLEICSVVNGVVGWIALWNWRRHRSAAVALVLFAVMASYHLFSTAIYFLSEALEGFPNVGPSAVDFWLVFFAVNSPWLLLPFCVLSFVLSRIEERLA